LPPGLGRLATKPLPTGSTVDAKTIGMMRVCCSGNRARLVVENFIGDMRRHAEPGQAGNYCPPEIMQTPSANAR
jgi:hypothetical protein